MAQIPSARLANAQPRRCGLMEASWRWGVLLIVLTMAIHAAAVVTMAFAGLSLRARSKNTLSAMAGRRKRPVRCSRKLRWSFFAVATSREGHRSPRSGRAGQHPRWDRGLPGIPASRRLSVLDTLLDAAMIFSGEENSYFDCY